MKERMYCFLHRLAVDVSFYFYVSISISPFHVYAHFYVNVSICLPCALITLSARGHLTLLCSRVWRRFPLELEGCQPVSTRQRDQRACRDPRVCDSVPEGQNEDNPLVVKHRKHLNIVCERELRRPSPFSATWIIIGPLRSDWCMNVTSAECARDIWWPRHHLSWVCLVLCRVVGKACHWYTVCDLPCLGIDKCIGNWLGCFKVIETFPNLAVLVIMFGTWCILSVSSFTVYGVHNFTHNKGLVSVSTVPCLSFPATLPLLRCYVAGMRG